MALVALVALVFAVYTGLYLFWNDEAMGRFVSRNVSKPLRGGGEGGQALVIRRAHYPYWGALKSLFLGGSAGIDVWDATVYDVDGKEILHVDHAHAEMYIGEVVWSQARALVARPEIALHFGEARVDHGRARIGLDSTGKVNLPHAFTGKVPKPPTPEAGGVRIRIDHAVIEDADYAMALPGWHGEVRHAHAGASLYASTLFEEQAPPHKVAFRVKLDPLAAPSGTLTLGDAFVFPFEGLVATRFEVTDAGRNDLAFAATTRTRGADVAVEGKLLDFANPDIGADLTIEFAHGAGLVALLPIREILGGDPDGEVRIHGPLRHILVDGRARGGEVHLVGITGRDAAGRFHLEGETLTLDELAVNAASGTVGGAITVDFAKLAWRGDLTCRRVDPAGLAPLVPAPARPVLAGRVAGGAHVEGSLIDHPERIRVRDLDLVLERRRRDELPRRVTARGALRLSPDEVRLDGLALAGDGVTATGRGSIDPKRLRGDTEVTVDAAHLGPLLHRLGLAFDVDGLHARARVRGPLLAPAADGTISATTVGEGKRLLPRVDARLRYQDGTLSVQDLRGVGPIGGRVSGEVALGLFDRDFTRPRRDPTLHVRLGAEDLSVDTLFNRPWLSGRASGHLALDGTVGNPVGSGDIAVPTLTLYGDPYRDGALDVLISDRRYHVERLALTRVGGGSVEGSGSVGFDGALDVDLRSHAFPLAAIPQLREVPVALAGALSGTVHVGGDFERWSPSGQIEAAAVKVREILLGDGALKLVPGGDATHLSGEFFRRFSVDGYLTLHPHIAVNVTVTFNDYPLEDLIPELKKLAEVTAKVSGTANFSFDLAQGLTVAELRLSKVHLSVKGEDEEDDEHAGRRTAEFDNEGPVIIATDGKKLTFKQALMRSALGEFQIRGDLSATASNLLVRGQVDLHLLEYFFSSVFAHTHGSAFADLRIRGAAARPEVLGSLDLGNAELTPRGAERPFTVPEGRVVFEPKAVKLHQLKCQLDGAEATAEASLGLDDWVPGDIVADVSGELSPTLLAWIFPDHIGETEGRLKVSAHVGGRWPQPTWTGQIEAKNVFFHEKRLGRDVRISDGIVVLENYNLKMTNIHARIDDTGDVRLDGTIALPGFNLGRVAVRLEGDNLDWASPGVYSLTVAPRVDLTGDGEHLKLAGTITLIAGRYQQNFEYRDLVIRPRAVESDDPFWKDNALLEDLELDLEVASSGALAIKDNLADLNVSVPKLHIRGTLSEPTFDGSIFVEEGGVFHIPFLRAEFISDKGTITFVPDREYPNETPSLAIHASSDWIDRYDQLHHILLTVSGTYREPFVDLSSTDGWNRTQVLAALLTGAAPDDLRRAVQNDPTAKNQGSAFDGLAKSVSGDFIGNIIEDPLKSVFKLDVARLELGSDSVNIKLCWFRTRYTKLCGTADVGFVSTTRYVGDGELRLSDDFSWSGQVERIEHGIDTSEDVVNRLRLQFIFRHPLH